MRRQARHPPRSLFLPCSLFSPSIHSKASEGDATSCCVYVSEKYNFLYDVKELSLTLRKDRLERTRNEELPVLLAVCHWDNRINDNELGRAYKIQNFSRKT
jgi:hypothetical protein